MTVAEGDFFGTRQRSSDGHRAVLVDHEWSVMETSAVR
jgi:hypothetical protein